MEDATSIAHLLQDKFFPLLIVVISVAIMIAFHGSLQPDQLFFVMALSVITCLGGKAGKRFVIDWSPITLFIILYDGMRSVADNLGGQINVRGPYFLETGFVGWLTNGKTLPFFLQFFRNSLAGSWPVYVMDGLAGFLYSIHFVAPFVFGWIIWHTYNDRKGFYAFAYTLTILNIMALATFFIYPAAPPWYVWKYHFIQPDPAMFDGGFASGLVHFDKLIHFPLFSSIYNELNPNAFAAIPSLHGSYPLLISYFAMSRWKNLAVKIVFPSYVALTWLAACYLNHHYLIDLVIGACYVLIAVLLYKYLVGPKLIEPLIFRKKNTNTFTPGESPRAAGLNLATVIFGAAGVILITLLLAHARGSF